MKRRSRLGLAGITGLAAAAVLTPAIAAPLGPPAPDPVPSIVFVARSDNPIDALAAGAVAGQVGGVVLLTPPTSLQPDTREALVDLDPDLVVLAGGTAAISADVFEEIQSLLPDADVVRKSGSSRFLTAAQLATLLDDLGIQGPVAAGAQRQGDVWIGGTLTAEDVVVPSGLDADTLGGLSKSDFALNIVPKTGTYRCLGDDFIPTDPANTSFVRETDFALTDYHDATFYRCPLHLPEGATITGFRMRVDDSVTSTGVRSMYLRAYAGTATPITLASLPDTGTTSAPGDYVLLEDTTIADNPASTVSNDYRYTVGFGIANTGPTFRAGVYYADVEYTVPAVPGTPAP